MRSKLTKALGVLAVVITLSVGLAVAAAAPAAAHGANQNGCSYVPDSLYFFDFHSSCDTHDLCYTFKWFGNSASGRQACDQLFYNDMKASCDTKWRKWYQFSQRATCKSVAWTYYTGVRWFGGSAFNSATPANVRVG